MLTISHSIMWCYVNHTLIINEHVSQNHKNNNTQPLATWKINSGLVIIMVRLHNTIYSNTHRDFQLAYPSFNLQVAECDDRWTVY